MKTSKQRYLSRIRVVLPRAIADLVPSFLINRRSETKTLLVALAERDLERVDWIAQRMVGGGAMFGFDQITVIGRMIRSAVASRNRAEIGRAVQEYAQYLERVQVEYRGAESALVQLALAPPARRRAIGSRPPRFAPAEVRTGELVSEAASEVH